MNRPTKLRQSLLRNKSFVRGKSDSRELTHLLMDGGKIHVSQEKHEEFLQIFAEDIKLGGKENYNFISDRLVSNHLSFPILKDHFLIHRPDRTSYGKIPGSFWGL